MKDDTELPRSIVFDMIDKTATIPQTHRMVFTDTNIQEIASQFLQEHITVFDNENRRFLLNAYKEHAWFNMTILNMDLSFEIY